MAVLISFELARALIERGGLDLLFRIIVSGYPVAQLPNADRHIHQIPTVQFIQQLRYNGTVEGVLWSSELLEVDLPILRAGFATRETYRYYVRPTLKCDISARGELRAHRISPDQLMAWGAQAESLGCRCFPGTIST